MPKHRSENSSAPGASVRPHEGLGGLGVLCTSRQVYDEVAAVLYNRELVFCVRTDLKPSDLKPSCPLEIHDLPGARWKDLNSLSFAKFKRIRIEVCTPELNDVSLKTLELTSRMDEPELLALFEGLSSRYLLLDGLEKVIGAMYENSLDNLYNLCIDDNRPAHFRS